MPPKCPVNCLLVQFDKAYEDEIVYGTLKLFKPPSLTPEWDAACTGTVVSVPDKVIRKYTDDGTEHGDYRGLLLDAQPGDDVIFSYHVVEDKELRDRDTPLHRNRFDAGGETYWKVDYRHVLGYVRNGALIAASRYVFLKDVVEEKAEKIGSLYLPQMSRRSKRGNRAQVVNGAGLAEGQTVVYPDRYAWRYEVKGQKIIVLPKDYLAAIETVPDENITCPDGADLYGAGAD